VTQPTLFVAGAGGKLGRRVVELLLERGYAGKIIAGSRHPEKLNFAGIETRKADYGDVPGFIKALEGVDRLLLISTDTLGPIRLALHQSAVAAAQAAGVKHIIYTSMPAPEPVSPIPFAPQHFGTEEAIKATGIGYTILRMNWYAENLLSSLPSALQTGKWYTSAGNGTLAHVSREDTARAAAGALLEGDASRTLTVTGPEALTTREIAAIASEVTGRSIEVVDVSDDQLAAGAIAAGVPAPVVHGFIVPFDQNTRLGRVALATNAVELLWGEKPQTLREFLDINRAALTQAA
jgi:NAD(P)H dehydrogenase (quinone)